MKTENINIRLVQLQQELMNTKGSDRERIRNAIITLETEKCRLLVNHE